MVNSYQTEAICVAYSPFSALKTSCLVYLKHFVFAFRESTLFLNKQKKNWVVSGSSVSHQHTEVGFPFTASTTIHRFYSYVYTCVIGVLAPASSQSRLFDWLNNHHFKSVFFKTKLHLTLRVNFKCRCCDKHTLEGLLQTSVTVLGDDMLNHLWVPWPVGTAAALLGLPPASGEILIHRSHGCSSNPPADAPSLLPRQPATCLLWHACVSVCLTQSVHPFVRPSVRQASIMKRHTGI